MLCEYLQSAILNFNESVFCYLLELENLTVSKKDCLRALDNKAILENSEALKLLLNKCKSHVKQEIIESLLKKRTCFSNFGTSIFYKLVLVVRALGKENIESMTGSSTLVKSHKNNLDDILKPNADPIQIKSSIERTNAQRKRSKVF